MDFKAIGNCCQRAAKAVKQLGLDAGGYVAARGFRIDRLVEARPAPAEPISLVGFVGGRSGKLFLKMRDESRLGFGKAGFRNHTFSLKPRCIELAHRRVLADAGIHQRLGEAGLVTLVMAEAAVAPHIDDDIAAKGLAIIDGELAGESHRFGIIAIDVQDRCLNALGHV